MMMNFEKIVERQLKLADEVTGAQTELSVEVGRPLWTEEHIEAVCPVFIRGWMNAPMDIYGSDLLNALECALRFVNSELSNISSPKRVLWPNGESYFD